MALQLDGGNTIIATEFIKLEITEQRKVMSIQQSLMEEVEEQARLT